jgi:carboxylate-amine ligase
MKYRIPCVGLEEEYQLVDLETGLLVPAGQRVLRNIRKTTESDIQHEMHLEQIEMATPVLSDSQSIAECILQTRKQISDAAMTQGSMLVAAATHPIFLGEPHITPIARYRLMAEKYQAIAKELMIFGFHIHIDMSDREIGVQVINRMRSWMPLLQAMSANSPFWNAQDTGYASFRRELWGQWPMSGVPSPFNNYTDYQECVDELVQSHAIDDPSKIYWDMRLPHRLPTIEIRICDVVTNISHVVALAAIMRALVMQCEHDMHRNLPYASPRTELVRAAMWQAARFGLSSTLIDLQAKRECPAGQLLRSLLDYLKAPLKELGDLDRVRAYVDELEEHGVPAETQRSYLKRFNGDMIALVKQLARDSITDSLIAT